MPESTSATTSWTDISSGTYATSVPVDQLAQYFTIGGTGVSVSSKDGISPQLYFKYIKSKMRILEKRHYERRLKQLEKAFDEFVEEGHDAMAKKTLDTLVKEVAYAELDSFGIKYVISRSAIQKYKNHIRGGHISNTLLSEFTRPVPKNIMETVKKLKQRKLFNEYWVYHYYNPKNEELKAKKEPVPSHERSAMRDPVLFGIRSDAPDDMFFIADWEDEYCDLTFEEIVCKIGTTKKESKIPSVGSELAKL